MSALEWPPVDNNGVSLPVIVSSTDLFDGELFGDELIDIYNTSVDTSDSHGMPGLLGSASKQETNGSRQTAGAMDDGLGAFRPSTSFSDLTTLLNPTQDSTESGKKRGAPTSSTDGPNKRKNLTKAAVRCVSVSKKSSLPSSSATAVGRKKGDTPDPLQLKCAKGITAQTIPMSPSGNGSYQEADFKSIAQVAVSNLMLTASSQPSGKSDAQPALSKDKVDTSTDHIKALTGNNWVAACATTTASTSQTQADNKANNRARRQNLTPDERARQNRDRNREHARNTRLRKKAYVEELKRTLTELVAQRDAAEVEKRQAAQRELEQREVRFRVLEEFLNLRGRNETNFSRWAAILEEGFELTLPLVDYEKLNKQSGKDHVLTSVAEVMAESSAFASFLQGLGGDEKGSVSVQYSCDRSNFVMDGCTGILEWASAVSGTRETGNDSGLTIKGVIKGRFSPASNKLVSASIVFNATSAIGVYAITGLKNYSSEDVAAAKAADAILDSLEIPSAVNVVHPSSSSTEGSDEKHELDSDESVSCDGKVAVSG